MMTPQQDLSPLDTADVWLVLAAHPELNYGGWGNPRGRTGRDYSQASIRPDAVLACADWCREPVNAARARRYFRGGSSMYGVKHWIERAIGRYVSQGEAITGGLLAGWQVAPGSGFNPVMRVPGAGRA